MANMFSDAPLRFDVTGSMLDGADVRRDMLDESARRVRARRRAQGRIPGAEGAAPRERAPEPMMVDPFTAVDALLKGTVPAYAQARREGLRAPTSREAVMGAAQALPGAGLPEARQSFEDAAVAAREGDVAGAVSGTGWGLLNALDAGIPGPAFAEPLAAMFVPASAAVRRQAEAMEAAGKSADEIWQTVGAERGVDGRWLEEIDDSKAVFADTNLPPDATLGDVMHHPELYERVPGLDALPVRPTSDGAGSLVPESMGGPRMELNPRLPLEDPGMRRQTRTEARRGQAGMKHVGDIGSLPKDRREVTMHETMHDLQERYGMPVGDSPRGIEEYLQGLERAKGASQDELDMIDGDFFYPRSAGEVQARNVPRRLFGMTAEERQRVRPSVTEDVPREDQIVRYRSMP